MNKKNILLGILLILNIQLLAHSIASSYSFSEVICNVTPGELPITRMNDSLALVALFDATNGSEWTNSWDKNAPINTWYGVKLNADKTRVSELNLSGIAFNQGNNLNGSLPEALGDLTALRILAITNNPNLSGNIPNNLNQLIQILQIYLNSNNLNGLIPIQFYELSTLQVLYLDANALSGNLHPNIGKFDAMTDLRLHSNDFDGSIPTTITTLENLRVLSIDNNRLTGSLPIGLGNLGRLEELQLNNNGLSGPIPAELGQLNLLFSLNLSNNQLSGSIPLDLSALNDINTLFLRDNQLSGCIPEGFSVFCNNGTNIDLSNNCQLPWGGDFRVFCSEATQDGAPCYVCPETQEGIACDNCTLLFFDLSNCNCGTIDCIEPIAEAGSSIILNCSDTIATLDASNSSSGSNFQYKWTTIDGQIISPDTLLAIRINQPGTYTILVTNLEGGCSSQDEVVVTQDLIAPNANAGSTQNLSCNTNTLQLSGINSLRAATFEWTTNLGNIISNNFQQAVIEVNQAGTYFLKVQSENGCSDRDSTIIVPIETLDTATITKIVPSCDGQENGQISIDVTGGTAPYTYIFNEEAFTNGFFDNLSEGVYEITITDAADCRLDLSPVELIATSSLPITINKTVLTSTCENESTSINACVTSNEGNYTFDWTGDYITEQNDDFNCSELIITPFESSFYQLKIRDENGCEFYDSLFVPVVGLEENAFIVSPNGDGIQDVLEFPCTNQKSELIITNRWGNQIFYAKPYNNDWGGTNRNGKLLPYGTYYYIFRFDTAKGQTIYGDILLLR